MKRRLAAFGNLSLAEAKLHREVPTGHTVVISDSVPPENAPDHVRIRASFLRYLALGGCDECRPGPKGVNVRGAYILGDETEPLAQTPGLDLEGATLPGDLALVVCRIPDRVLLRGAKLQNLFLNESHLSNGFKADGLEARGDVFLRNATVTGAVRLLGARLGGGLDCAGATLTAGAEGAALHADRLEARGSVFLSDSTVTGEVRLLGAGLGGGLYCTRATLTAGAEGKALSADGLEARGDVFLDNTKVTGEVRLLGARLGGDLSCTGATLDAGDGRFALNADGLRVDGTFFLRGGASIVGTLGLTDAEVGSIADDPKSWPRQGFLELDRFRYGAIVSGPVDADSRLKWLALQFGRKRRAYLHHARAAVRKPGVPETEVERQAETLLQRVAASGEIDPTDDFYPQPYEQLAKVFREMGHREDARTVLVEKERLQRADRRRRVRREAEYAVPRLDWLWDGLVGLTVGYGHRPLRAGAFLAGFWLLGAMIFSAAHDGDAIKPNDAFTLRSPDWVLCATPADATVTLPGGTAPVAGRAAQGQSQFDCFAANQSALGYPEFNAPLYALDTLLPVVAMEVQQYWIPDERTPVGQAARVYLWAHIALGWALSLLAVAGFSGLIRSD